MGLGRAAAAAKDAKCRAAAAHGNLAMVGIDHLPLRDAWFDKAQGGLDRSFGYFRGAGQAFDFSIGFHHANFPPDGIGINNIDVGQSLLQFPPEQGRNAAFINADAAPLQAPALDRGDQAVQGAGHGMGPLHQGLGGPPGLVHGIQLRRAPGKGGEQIDILDPDIAVDDGVQLQFGRDQGGHGIVPRREQGIELKSLVEPVGHALVIGGV